MTGLLWRAVLVIALVYLALLLVLYFSQSRLVHLPEVPGRDLTASPAQYGMPYEEISLLTEDDVRLHGWFLPVEGAAGTLLFFHGNAGNISHRLESLRLFRDLGLAVLIIDYRGYGRSEGRPSEDGLRRDARAALRYLQEELAVPAGEIVLFGRSLGGAVAAGIAAEREVGALIVESSFTSVPDLGAELYPVFPVRQLARLHYDTLEAIAGSRAPVLVIHSRDDEIIPFHHGQRLYEAAPAPKAFLELEGDHNTGFLRHRERYLDGIAEFLEAHLRGAVHAGEHGHE